MNIKLNEKLILMIAISVSLMNIISKGLIGRHVSKTKDIKRYYSSLIFKIIANYEYILKAILKENLFFRVLKCWPFNDLFNVGQTSI